MHHTLFVFFIDCFKFWYDFSLMPSILRLKFYGFLTHLRVGGCADAEFERILQLTEAFLLRRHVCRMRANETETAFARLCGADCAIPEAEVTRTYREYSPSDERFRQDFASAKFGAALIERARYCLAQFEMKQQGSHLELLVGGPDIVHVEHVIPQRIKTRRARKQFGDWPTYLGAQASSRSANPVCQIAWDGSIMNEGTVPCRIDSAPSCD